MPLPIPITGQNIWLIGLLTSTVTAILMSIKGTSAKGFKHITGWFRRKLVYNVRIYQYDELFYVLEGYLFSYYQQQYKDVEASLEFSLLGTGYPRGYSPEEPEEVKRIHYKQEDNTFIIHYKGKRIVIRKESEKEDKAASLKERYFRKYQLTGWRCKEEINEFLEGVLRLHEEAKPKSLVKIKISNSYGEWVLFDDLRVKPLKNVFLKSEIKDLLEKDVNDFCSGEEWYGRVGIPYKRGYCFYGSPGNGKTTLSLALAAKFNRDVHILNISAMDDDTSLQRAFSCLKRNSVLLIEDIDKVFVQRDAKQEKVSFSAFLNILDGALSKHGLIVIITTNHIEHLDPALLRDGRVDVKIEISNPDNRRISDYLSLFYQSPIPLEGIPQNDQLCMASIQEICVRNKNNPEQAKEEIIYKIIGKNLVVMD